mmetsp:Transcript_99538/g.171341  ORF Transcript_99538/g.171341 Transcript_99538/m.171341 type:complete len:230 (+) Transcript_99538:1558-2247(+)
MRAHLQLGLAGHPNPAPPVPHPPLVATVGLQDLNDIEFVVVVPDVGLVQRALPHPIPILEDVGGLVEATVHVHHPAALLCQLLLLLIVRGGRRCSGRWGVRHSLALLWGRLRGGLGLLGGRFRHLGAWLRDLGEWGCNGIRRRLPLGPASALGHHGADVILRQDWHPLLFGLGFLRREPPSPRHQMCGVAGDASGHRAAVRFNEALHFLPGHGHGAGKTDPHAIEGHAG